jgi:hypothetical protein
MNTLNSLNDNPDCTAIIEEYNNPTWPATAMNATTATEIRSPDIPEECSTPHSTPIDKELVQ